MLDLLSKNELAELLQSSTLQELEELDRLLNEPTTKYSLDAFRQPYLFYDKQRAFHEALFSCDVVLFNAGRGAGKTTSGAIEGILQATRYQPGERGIVIAPTYRMLADAAMYEFFTWLNPAVIESWNKTEKNLILTNGSEVAFRSADEPDSLRGPNRAWMWMDEPRKIRTREAFDVASAQIRSGTMKTWLTTTPAGIFHWIYELFVANPLPLSTYITAKTEENPYLSTAYAERLRAQYTGAFAAQELDAAFVSFEGVIYDTFSLTENVTEDADYNPALPVVWGVDDGYAHGDGPGTAGHHPRVILLCQQRGDGGFNVFAEYYRTLQLPETSIAEAMSWGYPAPTLAMVDSSASELRRRLSDAGIMNGGGTHVVTEGIKVVRRYICDGNGVRLLKIHPRCTNLIRELQTYRYDDHASAVTGGERKPLKMDDHTPDALRYLLWNYR